MTQTNSNSKVALLLPNLSGGGAERVMVILANEFSRTVSDVDLVILNDDNMTYVPELSKSVNLINLKTGRASRSIFSIRNYLRSKKPDALLTTLGHVSSVAALALSISGNVPTKLYVREDIAPRKIPLSKPFLLLVHYVQKWAYNKASAVITLSKDMATEVSRFYKLDTPIHTIYNPVKISEILSSAQRDLNPQLPWSKASKFVLGVGRLTKQKDFKTLISAVAEVRKTHDIKLVILGEGMERKHLEAQASNLKIEDSVYLPGFVSNPFAFMRAASIFALSSDREGLPNALIQAQVCSTECIATDCPTGPREILNNGEYGELVAIGNHLEMAIAIVKVIESRSTKTPDIEVLRRKYDPKTVAMQYLEVMQS